MAMLSDEGLDPIFRVARTGSGYLERPLGRDTGPFDEVSQIA